VKELKKGNMKTVIYSMHRFEKEYLLKYNNGKHELIAYDTPLDKTSAYLAKGCKAVSLFVTDDGSAEVLDLLKENGVKYITLRSAGFNHVDVKHARKIGLKVSYVPEYSPHAIAEHSVALLMALNRKLIIADRKIKDGNFSIDDLVGFDLHGETIGIIGTGKIGAAFARIMHGFGCRILAHDAMPDERLMKYYSVKYTSLNSLLAQSRVVSIHLPLTEHTHYLINEETIEKMQKGVILLNTSRGAIVDTAAVIRGLERGKIGAVGLDVYEK
jgi:D-lactate dehydrogenase